MNQAETLATRRCSVAWWQLPLLRVLERSPATFLAGNKKDPGPPNHAHRAEVSLVAPSTRVSGLGGNG